MADVALLPLVQNAAILLGLAVVYDLALARWTRRRGPLGPVIVGLMVGALGIAIMLTPWVLAPGIVFDTRSVLLAVTGLVFGPVPTIVAMVVTAAFRITQGGEGAAVGVAVIIASGSIGMAWRRLRRGPLEEVGFAELLALGVIVHGVMLALMLALPWATAMRVLGAIALPVILIYPVATALLGELMISRLRREHAAAEMRVSEERLRLALAAAEQGMYDLDLRTGGATVSATYAAMLGYDLGDFDATQTAWIERLHPDDRESVLSALRDYVEGRSPGYRIEFRQRTRSGDWMWILSLGEIVGWDAAGKPVRMIGAHTDITARRQAQEEARATEALMARMLAEATAARRALLSVVEDLKASEVQAREAADRYRLLVTHAPDAIFVNREDRVVLANQACVALFGAATEQDLLGKSPYELFHGDDHEAVREGIGSMRDDHVAVATREERIVRLDGRVVDVEVSASPFVEQGIVSIHVILRDITDRKLAQAALRRSAEELEQRVRDRTAELQEVNHELEAFAYSVSHDLRAPVRAVLGFGQILQRKQGDALDGDGRHYLANIIAASEQMGRLIDDLLGYSRLGRGAVRHEAVPLEPIVERLRMTFAHSLAQPGARLEAEALVETPMGDSTLVEQIVTNLVANALTYTRDGVAPEVRISARLVGDEVVIDVTDNGIGIDDAHREKIFEVFHRLHTEEEHAGTGIGLAIARKAARLMDGDITVDSTPGSGSTFVLHLPRRGTGAKLRHRRE